MKNELKGGSLLVFRCKRGFLRTLSSWRKRRAKRDFTRKYLFLSQNLNSHQAFHSLKHSKALYSNIGKRELATTSFSVSNRSLMLEPLFFPSGEIQLFGIWRAVAAAKRVWILCPPFAEEEKSAHRALTEIALHLQARGEASLLFCYRGTGDSEGDFADATLSDWRADIAAAVAAATPRAPAAQIGLLGVRLGASLAYLERARAQELRLIEPILSGRSMLSQLSSRQKMRVQMAGGGAALPAGDLDGWPLGEVLRAELNALDLREAARFEGESQVWGVGPRDAVAPPLQSFADQIGAKTRAIVMPAFWNLLDYTPPTPLLDALE